MRWYLAGPMSGFPDNNYPRFTQVAAELRAKGLDIVSPHEQFTANELGEKGWSEFLRRDLIVALNSGGVICMSGWTKSRGARLEVATALSVELPVLVWTGYHLLDLDSGALWLG